MVNMWIWPSGFLLVSTMWRLCSASNMTQKWCITSGIDMTLHDVCKAIWCWRNGHANIFCAKLTCCMLRICKWIWSGLCVTSFSWMCSMFPQPRFRHVFQQSQTTFLLPNCFWRFGKLHVIFREVYGEVIGCECKKRCIWVNSNRIHGCERHQHACFACRHCHFQQTAARTEEEQ